MTTATAAPTATAEFAGTSRPAASPLAIAIGLGTLYFVWGSTYVGIKVAVETMPPFLMASGRFLLAGALLLGWILLHEGSSALRIDRTELRDSFIVGALLLGGGMGMVALGERSVPASIAALFIALMPMWVAILGRAVFGERLPRAVGLGIALGIVGVAILVAPSGSGTFAIGGLIAVMLSPIFWASGSLYSSHRARLPRLPLLATSVQMLCGGLVLGVMALATGEFVGFDPATVSQSSWLAFIYLTTIGSVIGYTTFVWLIRVAPLPQVATYAYVNPVVAFVLGAIILGEEISPRTVIAAVVIIAAVALIITARSRAGTAAEASPADEPEPEISPRPAPSERSVEPAPSP
ncbi:MAG: EamA family transporter [Candidatus Limnocylindrales bacterium]